jgi:hypothetical protein
VLSLRAQCSIHRIGFSHTSGAVDSLRSNCEYICLDEVKGDAKIPFQLDGL